MPSNFCRHLGLFLCMLAAFQIVLRTHYEQVYLDGLVARFIHRLRAPGHRTQFESQRANATLVMLCRNSELSGVIKSMVQVEERFNRQFRYPWVFLNDEPFSDKFKMSVSSVTNASLSFGLIPAEQWVQPDWINEKAAEAGRRKLEASGTIYGGSVSYRNMCRFNSGFFYRHELLKQYRYYWRVEPYVTYYCDLEYDPFLYMQDHNKIYGFNIALKEVRATVPSLWTSVLEFMAMNPQYLAKNNSINFLSDDGGLTYNMCHFWSNFEIGDMDFFRGEAYSNFFNHLDQAGGFYYERWGDAPIHSIAAALFASPDQIHFFDDIGYRHERFQHCPSGEAWARGRCECNPHTNINFQRNSCISRYLSLLDDSEDE